MLQRGKDQSNSLSLVAAACDRQGLPSIERDNLSRLHKDMCASALRDFKLDLNKLPVPDWVKPEHSPNPFQKEKPSGEIDLYIAKEQMRAAYLAKNIMPLLDDVPEGHIVDIGTRSGFFPQRLQNLSELCGYKRKVTGLDLEQKLPTEGHEQLDFRKGQNPIVQIYNGRDMPYKDSSLAAVTLNFTLHHIEEPSRNPAPESERINNFLQEVNRIMKPGGVLIVTEDYMGKNLKEREKGNIYNDTILKIDDMFYPNSPSSQRSQKEWTNLLKKNGFSIEKEEHIAGYNVAGLPVVELLIKAKKRA